MTIQRRSHDTAIGCLLVLFLIATIFGGMACGVMRYRECRRIGHPIWYCLGDK